MICSLQATKLRHVSSTGASRVNSVAQQEEVNRTYSHFLFSNVPEVVDSGKRNNVISSNGSRRRLDVIDSAPSESRHDHGRMSILGDFCCS